MRNMHEGMPEGRKKGIGEKEKRKIERNELKLKKSLEMKNILFLTLAGLINAFGVTVFLAPVQLYDSGISGTSMLLAQITPEYLTLSIFLILLNFPLFFYGYKKQGGTFTFYAIYTVTVYSVGAWLITDVIPIDVSIASPLAGTDLLLCSIFGGVISGLGSGLALKFGGAMDGIEVMSVIFSKRLGISVGTFVMIYNVILYIICGFIAESWILPLYSIVTYFAALKTIDFIVEGIDRSKAAMIITAMPSEISRALIETFDCGTTNIPATGGFSNKESSVVYFVVNRFQIEKMKNIVHEIDPSAYITITEVADVFNANRQ